MGKITTSEKPPNRFAGDEGFKDKVVLITGATGFLGKVLIEKILRTCPLVTKIYVLVRPKAGKTAERRLEDLLAGPLFHLLRLTLGDEMLNKVIAINGDVFQEDLHLPPSTREILAEEVNIIYHMAATVRFNEPFKKTVLQNTRGTKYMLNLARECKQLLVFAYVSTAYCHLKEKVLYEKAYPPPADPNAVINFIETTDEETVEAAAKQIMGKIPYVYSFSKCLAEALVNDEMDKLPVIILRPSVVVPMWKDPLPGWTDNVNGPTGFLLAGGKGFLRSAYGYPETYGDYLPVDIAANLTMLATFDYMTRGTKRFYNLTSSNEIKVTFDHLIKVNKKALAKLPLNWVIWYPNHSMTSSRFLHNLYVVLFHYLPALLLDCLIRLAGKTPRMWKIQERISRSGEILAFYSTNQWDFNNDNLLDARNHMNQTEKEVYEVCTQSFNLEDYMYHATHGVRLYILNEGDKTLPTAIRHMKIMWVLDKFCKGLMVVYFGYLLMNCVVYPIMDTNSLVSTVESDLV